MFGVSFVVDFKGTKNELLWGVGWCIDENEILKWAANLHTDSPD